MEEIEEHFHDSSPSSPSSLFSIPPDEDPQLLSQLGGVLRDSTATPSESRGEQSSSAQKSGDSEHDTKGNKDGANDGQGGEAPNQNDVNSEPNDSSAEEESGEDDQTLLENMSLRLDESGRGLDPTLPWEERNQFLSVLRKKLLGRLVGNLALVEEVGGMRAMCYLQVGGWSDVGGAYATYR